MFELRIDTQNAAFEDGEVEEIARMLRSVADRLEEGYFGGGKWQNIHDINGNAAGKVRYNVI